ncbi:MAG TPA: phenylphosphate carboxylase subunit delta [Armatimonadetes bacterium]|nr:phenylphosphate carboxylase subunit delta [Armatimonadota bacterium]
MERRLSRVRAIIFDVDGVLTDGTIYVLPDGSQALAFYVRDGLGIRKALEAGLVVALASGRDVEAVRHRARDLGIPESDLILGREDKLKAVEEWLKSRGIGWEEVIFVGDDELDLEAMRKAAVGVAVADASPELKREADYITEAPGGRGAVREVVELVLRTKRERGCSS